MSRSNRDTLWRTTNAGGKRAATRTVDLAKTGDSLAAFSSISFTEDATTCVGMTGTYTTGLDLGDGCTTGIDIGAATTGIDFTGLVSSQVIDYTTVTSVGETTDAHLIRYGTSAAPIVYAPSTAGSHSGIQMHMTAANVPTGLSLAGIRAYVTYTGATGSKATAYGGLFWVKLNCTSAGYTGDYLGGTPAGVQGVIEVPSGAVALSANAHQWLAGVAGEVRPLGTITKTGVISGLRAVINANTDNISAGVLVGVHVGAYLGTVDTGVLVLPHVGSTFTTGLHLDSQYGTITTGIDIGACTTGLAISGAVTNAIAITATGSTATDGHCLKIGSSSTPITIATTGTSSVKSYSDYSKTSGYHVGAWFSSRYTADGASTGSVYALRGHADLEATQTTTGTAAYIVGVHGRVAVTGTAYNSSTVYAGVLAQMLAGGTLTAVNKMYALWVDNQLATNPTAGTVAMVGIRQNNNSSTAVVDHCFDIYGARIANFINFDTCAGSGAFITATGATAGCTTLTKKIQIGIDGVTYYLLATTTPA